MIEQAPPRDPAALPGTAVPVWTAPLRDVLPPDGLSRLHRLAARLAGHPEALQLLGEIDAVAQELSEYQLAADRLRFLSEAGELLASPTDVDSTLQRVARLAVPRLADLCLIYLLDEDGGVRQVAGQHVNPAEQVLLENLGRGFRAALTHGSPASVTLETGQAMLTHDGSLDLFEPRVPNHSDGPPPTCSSMTVPLRVRGRTLGLICLTSAESGRRFEPADLELARELADRAALAVDNATLFREAETTRAQLDTLFRSTPVGLALLDRDLRYVRVNDALARLLGQPPRALTGRFAGDLDPRFQAEIQAAARRLMQGGESVLTQEVAAQVPGGDRVGHWLVTLHPVRTASGLCLGLGAAVVDITARKEAELAGQAAREAAEAASRAKSQFLGVISHELRTPLTTVIGYADLLIGGLSGPVTERQREQLRRIKTSAWNLVSIIEEILTFSRAEAGKEEAQLEPTDVAALAREAAEMMEPQAHSRGLHFRARLLPSPRYVVTDGGKVRQIILNLLGNAVKFTDEGAVELELAEVPGGLALHVGDTGPGIAPENLESIFEPFRQVDQSSTRQKGGTGLGLAVSRHLARLIGGEVTVESEPGRGSTFTLWLTRELPQSAGSRVTLAATPRV